MPGNIQSTDSKVYHHCRLQTQQEKKIILLLQFVCGGKMELLYFSLTFWSLVLTIHLCILLTSHIDYWGRWYWCGREHRTTRTTRTARLQGRKWRAWRNGMYVAYCHIPWGNSSQVSAGLLMLTSWVQFLSVSITYISCFGLFFS